MEGLPHRTYTLLEFNALSKELLGAGRESDFIRFALTGEVDGHQAVIDPYVNRISNRHSINLRRDYDSLIGVSSEIEIKSELYIFPLSRHEDTLKTNIHLTWPIRRGNMTHAVPIGQIPNIMLGKWGVRNMLRVMFPAAWVPGKKYQQQLSQGMQRDFFERALRPAIESLTPEEAEEWPVTYSDEMFRGRRANGAFSFQQKILDAYHVPMLPGALREKIDEKNLGWADGCLFLHQVRGTKSATTHDPVEDESSFALDAFLEANSIHQRIQGKESWWIDVGVECIDSKGCLLWRTDSHGHVVQHISGITDRQAGQITSPGSSAYQQDLTSHLTAVSGCRITPGSRTRGPHQIMYIQMYTTEKSLVYNPDGRHHGKAMTGMGAIEFKAEPSFCRSLYELYRNARSRINSHARLEVRVPIKSAKTVLLNIPPEVLRQSLVGLHSTTLWHGCPAFRLLAASRTLILQHNGPAKLRISPNALTLTAGIVWFINSLHSRPEEGKAARDLVASILPHAGPDDHEDLYTFGRHRPAHENEDGSDSDDQDDSEDAQARPSVPYGAVFFRALSLPDVSAVPRLKSGRTVNDETLRHYFGKTLSELRRRINPIGILTRDEEARYRIPTSKKLTPTYVNLTGEPRPNVFSLERQGYSLPPEPVDFGSDLEGDACVEAPSDSLDERLSQIWRQFLIDIVAKSPNPHGAGKPSYCRISVGARTEVGEDVYKNETLSDIWRACRYKIAKDTEWETAFGHLWPPKHSVTSAKAQNYRLCSYFISYKELIASVDDNLANVMRSHIRAKVNRLYWIPHATSDKIWNTSRTPSGFTTLPQGHAGAAPRLLVKGRNPKWEEDAEEDGQEEDAEDPYRPPSP
ncbi:hypothetical protein BD779DRAFT_1438914 [Infundibulicybe gibba]|nr:hypothetical protein BD779DRAFT_1438914 [Infundibulicybe gibba]